MSHDRAAAAVDLPKAVGELLDLSARSIAPDANLIELGLDSLTMMRLAGDLNRAGIHLGFAELAAEPTLAAWQALVDRRRTADAPTAAEPAAVEEDAPFDLALMQHAYWVGRADGQQLGGVAAHFYHEFDGTGVDPERLEAAVLAVFARHGMLRVHVLDDGRQRIAPQAAWPGLRVHDLRERGAAEAEAELAELRRCLSHRTLDIAAGEVLDVRLTLLPDAVRAGGTRLHLNLDMVAADALSLRVLLADLARAYTEPERELPTLGYSFPRYLADRAAAADPAAREADRAHWHARLPDLPAAPALPLTPNAHGSAATTVLRRHRLLDTHELERFEAHARRHGLTPAMALAAVFAETLTAFSAEPDLLLNLPLFDRAPLHPEVGELVGDFTSSVLLAWDGSTPGTFAERALRLQRRFHEDAAHAGHSGVEVLRDLSRLHGEQVLAPVVYTSALGLGELFAPAVREAFGEASWIISQGPQVWLDAQVTEVGGGLLVNWDAREDAFAPGVLDAMFAAYSGLLDRLTADAAAWSAAVPALLPDAQLAVRARTNDTRAPRTGARLHDGFFAHAATRPKAPALLWGTDGILDYGQLAERALALAGHLRARGAGPGELVAVTLPKGPDQVVAVLAVLATGAAYLPLGVDQPAARRERIHRSAGIRLVVEEIAVPAGTEPLPAPVPGGDGDLAYVIHTSGSTGEPKGVELTHAAAMNTVEDLNSRLTIGSSDRTLALSALDFDLSVYDVFGPLSAGGAVVCVEEPDRRDATAWVDLAARHGATVVNCVPALLDMLVTAADRPLTSLRAVLLGGDRVPLDLPARLAALAPRCRFAALGGTTETAVHSTWCEVREVPADWATVPYGTPLENVVCRVVDPLGRDRPDHVPGELWIGGAGVARGYRGDPDRTAERFTELDGVRWYRTGDRARYRPDGTLEFLGRADHQVKVRGHRIELGEIETALTAFPGVARGVAVVCADGRIAAAVTDDRAQPPADWSALATVGALRDGATPAALREHLRDVLPAPMVPERIAVLPGLPLTANGKIDRGLLRRVLAAAELPGRTQVTPPAGEAEQRAASVWAEVLGVEVIGREHDFFALGGDSLLATRLIGRLRAAGFAGVRLSELFAHPVLADFAATLRPLEAGPQSAALAADPARRHDPFPLTDVQRAYWLGRGEGFTLGGTGCHYYREYEVPDLDPVRLEEAVNRLVARHEMLRAVVDERGEQRILAEVPRFTLPVTEAGDDPEAAFAELREAASHQVFDPGCWPLFAIRAVRAGGRTRLGIGMDNIVLDALSILRFYGELGALYEHPDAELPPVDVSFRDYVLGSAPAPQELAAARAYWAEQLPVLPPGPQLPLAMDPAEIGRPRFSRREALVPGERWRPVAERAREHGLTPSAVLLAAFAEVLGRWSARPDLTVNLTLFDRRDVHPDIGLVMGDFTSLVLVPSRPEPGESRLAAARRVQRELWRGLDHREVSAVEVLRELARFTGEPETTMPVVFTSALGVGGEPAEGPFTAPVWGVSQTPQVWLDHQVTETADGGVRLTWDVVDGLFPDGLVDEMFAAYRRLVDWLGEAGSDWRGEGPDLLPEAQLRTRAAVNATGAGAGDRLLHAEFFRLAAEEPGRTALVWGEDGSLTYGELARRALRVATVLRERGAGPGELVAVTLPKGPEQLVAVLGVLATGAAYLPLGVDQPAARRERIVGVAGARLAVTEEVLRQAEAAEPAAVSQASPDDLAYVIFTSGSTGEPKGVEITHRAAANTVTDVNERFGLAARDRTLAVSALDFDLSVYDVFGPLSAGGAVVLIGEEDRRDARRWLELVRRHGVTVWNTVPALLDMLLTVAEAAEAPEPLRLALVSGDWVGLDLPVRLAALRPECRFVALGGATEAAIWSNCFEVAGVDPAWRSVPYGRPLRGQRFRVVDALGRDCPDGVPGEFWIGGAGVARGYRGAVELTARRFVAHAGERWYRTGDLGRYWADGTLEFLGRADQQVKLRGHRIELGEIESALRSGPGVGRAVAAVVGEGTGRRLVAGVVPVPAAVRTCAAPGDVGVPTEVAVARAGAWELEADAASAVLARLLGLDALGEGTAWRFEDLVARLDAVDEHRAVLRLWLGLLVERKVLAEEGGRYLAGPELASALLREAPRAGADAYGALIARAHRRLLERLGDYREILAGRVDPAALLDDDVLAPACLADHDPGTALALDEIAAQLADLSEALGRPVEVAELAGRDGRTAERLLGLIGPDQVRYTLLDAAPGLVATAAGRLEALPHETVCLLLPGTTVPDDLRYGFDVVLAANVLHRHPEPGQGPALAALLARPGGRLLAVERAALTPVALLTAGLLDRGYDGFDRERRLAGSPMLPGERWAELFARAGLSGAGHRPVGGSFMDLLWAERPQDAAVPDPAALREHLAGLLPGPMVPERIEVLPWLPLSANGKVDRRAVAAVLADGGGELGPDEPPEGEMECELAAMWRELLGIPEVGRRRGFFELGGDSLLATRFITRVRQRFAVELPLRRIFAGPGLAQVAAVVAEELAQLADVEEGAL
ncbi:non-ribosomal peptide synthetase [Streptomyces sp. NRRL WC-3742]|uniref:non-ribosomal peptide synthetase n=1 Tax=Streptomyces sp. NRRL WC-3742 TaxID=1463934 RepID=UPI0004C6A2DD|nr:non-ribosomal peptide synthetase [Streptomyces sp. NRRL WC-3742]